MAQLQQPFNAREVNPEQGIGGLPIGKHIVIAYESEIKANKDQTGGYLQFNLKIIDGPAKDQHGSIRFNIYNSSGQAVDIARKQLSAFCHSIGVFDLSDTNQCHNIPFMVEVGPQKSDPQYTEVKRFFDRNGNEPGKPAHNNAPAQQPAAQQAPAPATWGQPAQQPAHQGQQPGGWGHGAEQAPAQQQQPQQPSQPAGNPGWGQQPAQQPAAPAQGWGAQPVQGNNPGWGQAAPAQQQPQQQPTVINNPGPPNTTPWGR